MKKFIFLTFLTIMGVATASAQYEESMQISASRAKAAKKMSSANLKPESQDKKAAKELKKKGWQVVGSAAPIEQQIRNDRFLKEQEMLDEYGTPSARYYEHSTISIGETYNAAFLAARSACQTEVQSQIETKIAGVFERQIVNQQEGKDAVSVDDTKGKIKSIIQGCLNNARPGMQLYRENRNGNTEVMVTYFYDKKTIAQQLKKKLREALRDKSDEQLGEATEEAISALK